MNIDGSTQIVGVFGSPITHTASPAMHNAAFAALKLNWAYLPFHVEPQNLRQALLGLRDMNFRGVNLTVPHKILALEIVDEVDPAARKLGAVNTVVVEAGKLRGFNTDGYGFAKAIKEDFDMSLKGKRVLVLGAGGAGRAIAIQCATEGATKIVVANRTAAKAQAITAVGPVEVIGLTGKELHRAITEVDLLVNATSIGLKEGDVLPLTSEMFTSQLAVYDTIYRPAETALIRQAAEGGAKVANGLSMLLHQGAKSFEIWTKRKAPLTVMRRALQAAVYGEPA
jgi:shikimate dehydrogenase